MMDPSLSKQKKAELLRKAVTGHKNYVAEVSSISSFMINFRWKYLLHLSNIQLNWIDL